MGRLKGGNFPNDTPLGCRFENVQGDCFNTALLNKNQIKQKHVLSEIENLKELKSRLEEFVLKSKALYHSFSKALKCQNSNRNSTETLNEKYNDSLACVTLQQFLGRIDLGGMYPLDVFYAEIPAEKSALNLQNKYDVYEKNQPCNSEHNPSSFINKNIFKQQQQENDLKAPRYETTAVESSQSDTYKENFQTCCNHLVYRQISNMCKQPKDGSEFCNESDVYKELVDYLKSVKKNVPLNPSKGKKESFKENEDGVNERSFVSGEPIKAFDFKKMPSNLQRETYLRGVKKEIPPDEKSEKESFNKRPGNTRGTYQPNKSLEETSQICHSKQYCCRRLECPSGLLKSEEPKQPITFSCRPYNTKENQSRSEKFEVFKELQDYLKGMKRDCSSNKNENEIERNSQSSLPKKASKSKENCSTLRKSSDYKWQQKEGEPSLMENYIGKPPIICGSRPYNAYQQSASEDKKVNKENMGIKISKVTEEVSQASQSKNKLRNRKLDSSCVNKINMQDCRPCDSEKYSLEEMESQLTEKLINFLEDLKEQLSPPKNLQKKVSKIDKPAVSDKVSRTDKLRRPKPRENISDHNLFGRKQKNISTQQDDLRNLHEGVQSDKKTSKGLADNTQEPLTKENPPPSSTTMRTHSFNTRQYDILTGKREETMRATNILATLTTTCPYFFNVTPFQCFQDNKFNSLKSINICQPQHSNLTNAKQEVSSGKGLSSHSTNIRQQNFTTRQKEQSDIKNFPRERSQTIEKATQTEQLENKHDVQTPYDHKPSTTPFKLTVPLKLVINLHDNLTSTEETDFIAETTSASCRHQTKLMKDNNDKNTFDSCLSNSVLLQAERPALPVRPQNIIELKQEIKQGTNNYTIYPTTLPPTVQESAPMDYQKVKSESPRQGVKLSEEQMLPQSANH